MSITGWGLEVHALWSASACWLCHIQWPLLLLCTHIWWTMVLSQRSPGILTSALHCIINLEAVDNFFILVWQVCQVSEKTVLQQKAYMLFYVRNINHSARKVHNNAYRDNIMPNSSESKGFHASLGSEKLVQHCATESRTRAESNFVLGSEPLSSVQIEKKSAKNAFVSPKPGLLKDFKHQICPSKEPSPSVSPLSSLTSEDLVPDVPAQKPSPRGSSIQSLEEDLMQTAQSKDKSASLTSAEQDPPIDSSLVNSFSLVSTLNAECIYSHEALIPSCTYRMVLPSWFKRRMRDLIRSTKVF